MIHGHWQKTEDIKGRIKPLTFHDSMTIQQPYQTVSHNLCGLPGGFIVYPFVELITDRAIVNEPTAKSSHLKTRGAP